MVVALDLKIQLAADLQAAIYKFLGIPDDPRSNIPDRLLLPNETQKSGLTQAAWQYFWFNSADYNNPPVNWVRVATGPKKGGARLLAMVIDANFWYLAQVALSPVRPIFYPYDRFLAQAFNRVVAGIYAGPSKLGYQDFTTKGGEGGIPIQQGEDVWLGFYQYINSNDTYVINTFIG